MSSLLGHGRKWAGCGVIPVYRDWRQFQKYKSGAVLNLKVARKEGSRGRLSEQFVNGLVPKNGTQLQKGKLGVGATSERAIGRGGWNRGCATPYRTALYRTWGHGNQPSGLSPGSAEGPSDGRWKLPRLSLLVDGVVCLPSSLRSRNTLRNGERGGPVYVPGLVQSPPLQGLIYGGPVVVLYPLQGFESGGQKGSRVVGKLVQVWKAPYRR